MNTLSQFINMNGYGIYIWPAYGITVFVLFIQWLFTFRRWRRCKLGQHESHS